MRAPKPLVVRAGLSRTFGSIAGFAALGLLSMGVYLLTDAFAHPVDAGSAGVIVAAFAIAIAMLLIVFIFRPWRLSGVRRHKESPHIAQERSHSSATQLILTPGDRARSDLPYQRAFVDNSRIKPRTPPAAQARGIAGK